jgi:TRAP-type mannitol/chloroaromatic compound transport system permease large subunit
VILLISGVIGSIYTVIDTATEAAAVGVVGA